MKESTRSALISALVFPGAGHLYLKQYVQGALLAIGTVVATYFIMSNVMQLVREVAGNIQAGGVPPEFGAIMELVSQQSIASDGSTNSALIALLILWFIGVLDSFRVGYLLDKSDGASGKN